jgi:translation initiation factor 1
MSRKNETRLVFSTETGSNCNDCGKPLKKCSCQEQPIDKGDGIVRVSRETKGRKGKGVSLITGLSLPADELKKLAKELKQKSGTGGAIKNGIIEIQTDNRDLLVELLKAKGFTVKKAGG